MYLLIGYRAMLHAARHDHELTFPHHRLVVPEFHAQSPVHHQEQFVLVVVVVPHEFALQLDHFHLTVVYVPDYARITIILKLPELFSQIHGLHGYPLERFHRRDHRFQHALRRFRPRGLRVDP